MGLESIHFSPAPLPERNPPMTKKQHEDYKQSSKWFQWLHPHIGHAINSAESSVKTCQHRVLDFLHNKKVTIFFVALLICDIFLTFGEFIILSEQCLYQQKHMEIKTKIEFGDHHALALRAAALSATSLVQELPKVTPSSLVQELLLPVPPVDSPVDSNSTKDGNNTGKAETCQAPACYTMTGESAQDGAAAKQTLDVNLAKYG